jgi:hypothetical protein
VQRKQTIERAYHSPDKSPELEEHCPTPAFKERTKQAFVRKGVWNRQPKSHIGGLTSSAFSSSSWTRLLTSSKRGLYWRVQQRTKSDLISSTVRSEVAVSDGAEDLRDARRFCCCGKEKVVNATALEAASINEINLHSNMIVCQRWNI